MAASSQNDHGKPADAYNRFHSIRDAFQSSASVITDSGPFPKDSRFEPQNRTPFKVDGLALRGHALAPRAYPPRTVQGAEAGKINTGDSMVKLTNIALNDSAR